MNEITGIVEKVLPIQEGVSKSGNAWKKLTVVIRRIDSQYNRYLALDTMHDADKHAAFLKPGMHVRLIWDVESREYNGRWYTNCTFIAVDEVSLGSPAPQPQWQQPQPRPYQAQPQQPQATYDPFATQYQPQAPTQQDLPF